MSEFPTITADPSAMPDGLIAYLAEFEDGMGCTETKPMAAPGIVECAQAASIWAKAHGMEVRWIAEFGWTDGLV